MSEQQGTLARIRARLAAAGIPEPATLEMRAPPFGLVALWSAQLPDGQLRLVERILTEEDGRAA